MSHSPSPRSDRVRSPLFLGIRAKILILFGCAFALVLGVVEMLSLFGVPFTSYTGVYGREHVQVMNNLTLIADLKKERFELWLEERKNQMIAVADDIAVSSSLGQIHDLIEERLKEGKKLNELLRNLPAEPSYHSLYKRFEQLIGVSGAYRKIQVADGQTGSVVCSTAQEDIGLNVSHNPAFLAAFTLGHESAVAAFKDPATGTDYLVVSKTLVVPSKGEMVEDRAVGVLLGYVDMEAFLRPLLYTGGGMGQTGEVLLVNQDARNLVSPKYSLHGRTHARLLEDKIGSQPVMLAIQGKEGVVATEDDRQVPVLAAHRHIRVSPDQGWGLVVKRDERDIYAPLKEVARIDLLLGLACFGVSAVLVWLLSGWIARPVARLAMCAADIQAGNLDVQAPVTTSDELGILARVFNSMVRRMRGWHEELEQQVQARTDQLCKANEQLEREIALHKTAQEELLRANETLEQRIQERTAELWAANENLSKEVEKRKRAELRLRESERQLELAYYALDNTGDEIFWIGKDAAIIDVNKAACNVLGYTKGELLSLTVPDIDPNYPAHLWEAHRNELREKKALCFESSQKTKQGENIPTEVSLTHFEYGGVEYTCAFVRVITVRKQAEHALRESEEKFAKAFQNSPHPIAIIRATDGKHVDVNEAWIAISGYSREEAIGRTAIELGLWSNLAQRDACIVELTEKGRVRDFKAVLMARSKEMTSLMSGEFFEMQGERYILWTFQDITERKEMIDSLRRSEALLNSIIDQSPFAMWISDDNGTLIRLNQACRKVLKITDADVVGRYNVLRDNIIEEQGLKPLLESVFQRGETVNFEITYETPQLKQLELQTREPLILDVTVFPVKDLNGKVTNAVIQHIDISRRKQAEETLQRRLQELDLLNSLGHQVSSSLRLEEVVSAAIEGLKGPLNPDLTLMYVREEDQLMLRGVRPGSTNFPRNQAQTRVGECLCRIAAEEATPVLSGDICSDPRCTLEDCKKAAIRSFAALPLLIEDRVVGVLGLAWREVRDFTEQASFLSTLASWVAVGLQNALFYREIRDHAEELERRVNERTAQLQAANKELEAFSYSVSHDLKAPLRAITGFAEILARRHRDSLNEEGKRYFDNIVEAGSQMGRLIDDLLRYSRIGREAVRLRPISLRELFHKVVESLSARIEESRALVSIPEDLPTVRGDVTLLSQIFANLLENALMYRHPLDPPRIVVDFRVEGHEAVIGVVDNGLGIASEYHKKIFNMFQRLHSYEEYAGTGIGLAIVKKSVHLLGGEVWVESEEGQGSCFFVRLRLAGS